MMFLSRNATIAQEKLTQYLLVPLPKDDKSKFLQQAGYTLDNWQLLEADLRSQVLTKPADFLGQTPYGKKYQIHAILTGLNGVKLEITTIWMVTDQQTKFVTLVPSRHSQ